MVKSSGTPNHLYVSFHHTFGNLLRSTSWAVSRIGTRGKTVELYRVTTAPLLIRPQKPSAALGGNQPPASMKGGVPNDRIASSSHSKGQVCEIYIYIYIYTTPDNHPCCQSTGAGECISSCHVAFEQAKTWDVAIGRGRESGIIIPFQVPAGGPTCPVPWHAIPRYGGPTLSPTNPRLSTAFNKKVFSDRERKTDQGRLRRRTAFRVRAGEAVGA